MIDDFSEHHTIYCHRRPTSLHHTAASTMAAVLAMAVVASTPPLIFAARLMHIIRQGSGGSKNLAVNTTSSKSASSSLASAKRSAALVSFGVRGFCASMGWFLLTFGLWSNFVPVDQWPINFMWNMVLGHRWGSPPPHSKAG